MLGHRSNLEGIILARKKIAKTLFCGKQLSFVKRTIFVNSFSSSISLSRLNYPLLLILHYLPSPPFPFSLFPTTYNNPSLFLHKPIHKIFLSLLHDPLFHWRSMAVAGIGVRKQKIFPHASSLASMESLSLPLVSAFFFLSLAFVFVAAI